jgi:hypothetical protein
VGGGGFSSKPERVGNTAQQQKLTIPSIFHLHRFRKPAKKIPGKCGLRFYKNVGLGYKTPKEAIEGAFVVLRDSE